MKGSSTQEIVQQYFIVVMSYDHHSDYLLLKVRLSWSKITLLCEVIACVCAMCVCLSI